jgi:hypothetical protein
MYRNRPSVLEHCVCCLWFACFASLAFIALSERSLALGGYADIRLGGGHAALVGLLLVGAALLMPALLLRYARFRRLLLAGIGLAYLVFVGVYLSCWA